MPGPAPKPTALKLLQGNAGKRALNKREPKFSGVPVCPEWLTPSAKTEWDRVVKELSALDMIKSVDSSALAAYCQSYARWQSAERMIDCDGQTVMEPITNKAGEIVAHKVKCHPAVGIARNALTAMLRASALFGFDPSSRSRLSVGEPTAADPFEAFMQGIGANEDIHAEEAVPNPR